MRTSNTIIVICLLALLLSACNRDLDQEEILSQAASATENLQSFTVHMDMVQNLNSATGTKPINVKANIQMDMIADPLSIHQTMAMKRNGESIDMNSYMTHEDGFFMYDPTQDKWIKLPIEMYEQMLTVSQGQMNPQEQLQLLTRYANEFTIVEQKNGYELTLTTSGDDKPKNLLQEMVETGLPLMQGKDVMDHVYVDQLTYIVEIDKETHYPLNIKMQTNMSMTMEKNINVSHTINASYSNFNKIKSIEIPEEIKENTEILS